MPAPQLGAVGAYTTVGLDERLQQMVAAREEARQRALKEYMEQRKEQFDELVKINEAMTRSGTLDVARENAATQRQRWADAAEQARNKVTLLHKMGGPRGQPGAWTIGINDRGEYQYGFPEADVGSTSEGGMYDRALAREMDRQRAAGNRNWPTFQEELQFRRDFMQAGGLPQVYMSNEGLVTSLDPGRTKFGYATMGGPEDKSFFPTPAPAAAPVPAPAAPPRAAAPPGDLIAPPPFRPGMSMADYFKAAGPTQRPLGPTPPAAAPPPAAPPPAAAPAEPPESSSPLSFRPGTLNMATAPPPTAPLKIDVSDFTGAPAGAPGGRVNYGAAMSGLPGAGVNPLPNTTAAPPAALSPGTLNMSRGLGPPRIGDLVGTGPGGLPLGASPGAATAAMPTSGTPPPREAALPTPPSSGAQATTLPFKVDVGDYTGASATPGAPYTGEVFGAKGYGDRKFGNVGGRVVEIELLPNGSKRIIGGGAPAAAEPPAAAPAPPPTQASLPAQGRGAPPPAPGPILPPGGQRIQRPITGPEGDALSAMDMSIKLADDILKNPPSADWLGQIGSKGWWNQKVQDFRPLGYDPRTEAGKDPRFHDFVQNVAALQNAIFLAKTGKSVGGQSEITRITHETPDLGNVLENFLRKVQQTKNNMIYQRAREAAYLGIQNPQLREWQAPWDLKFETPKSGDEYNGATFSAPGRPGQVFGVLYGQTVELTPDGRHIK